MGGFHVTGGAALGFDGGGWDLRVEQSCKRRFFMWVDGFFRGRLVFPFEEIEVGSVGEESVAALADEIAFYAAGNLELEILLLKINGIF